MAKNKVEIVGIETSKIKTIPSEKTIELLQKYQQTNDKIYLDEAILGNLKLVLSIVNKFSRRCDNLDDLFQIGTMGLIKAVNNFDINQDVRFSTYAVPMIEGEIRRYLRDSSFLRVSRQIKDLAYHFMKEKEKYINEFGKSPENSEICKILQVSEYQILEAIESTMPLSSLDEPIYNDFDDSIVLHDIVPTNFNEHHKMVTYMSLEQGIDSLEDLEKKIIKKRYYEGLSQVEIAEEFNISQAQVSRLEKNALRYLRNYVI